MLPDTIILETREIVKDLEARVSQLDQTDFTVQDLTKRIVECVSIFDYATYEMSQYVYDIYGHFTFGEKPEKADPYSDAVFEFGTRLTKLLDRSRCYTSGELQYAYGGLLGGGDLVLVRKDRVGGKGAARHFSPRF